VALVLPFRAVRYTDRAGPLDRLVAPPYDVLDAEQRAEHAARSPYNVVHLTLPPSAEDAAATWRAWLDEGVLARDDDASAWVVEQDVVGPDGVARTRTGLLASLRVEPYETGAVLPHERTHRGPKEERLALLHAVGAQLEPILLLHDGPAAVSRPDGPPALEAGGARLWRVGGEGLDAFADRQLLIADGHHRYETAVAFAQEAGTEESAGMPVVLVSTEDPGLAVFATHRVFARAPEAPWEGEPAGTPDEACARLEALPRDRAALVEVRRGEARLVRGDEEELDVELVGRLGTEGIAYTPDREEAVHRVESGEAEVAYLLRPTPLDAVFRVARAGGVLPQKSTYFHPKLLSGLLFHPVR
jgi:uncharacterized protein (DUF1015 family)